MKALRLIALSLTLTVLLAPNLFAASNLKGDIDVNNQQQDVNVYAGDGGVSQLGSVKVKDSITKGDVYVNNQQENANVTSQGKDALASVGSVNIE